MILSAFEKRLPKIPRMRDNGAGQVAGPLNAISRDFESPPGTLQPYSDPLHYLDFRLLAGHNFPNYMPHECS